MANQHLQTPFLADIHQQSLCSPRGLEPSRQKKKQHLKGLGEVQQKQVDSNRANILSHMKGQKT